MPFEEQIAPYEHLSLPLEPVIGRTMLPVREILELGPGSLIRLSHAVGSVIEVRVGNAPFGSANLVASGDKLAVKFSRFHKEA